MARRKYIAIYQEKSRQFESRNNTTATADAARLLPKIDDRPGITNFPFRVETGKGKKVFTGVCKLVNNEMVVKGYLGSDHLTFRMPVRQPQ